VCMNTLNGLVNECGNGFLMEISLAKLNENEIREVVDHVNSKLKDLNTSESNTLILSYQIPKESNKLSVIFKTGVELFLKYGCEYVISQMTVDQLFLQITREQRISYRKKDVKEEDTCCGNICCCAKGVFCKFC